MDPEPADLPLTTTEAADMIGVTPGRIRSYIFECANCGINYTRHLARFPGTCDDFQGRLPAIRAGRDWRILSSELQNFTRRPPGRPPKIKQIA
jgi:Helix-turn-helix domain